MKNDHETETFTYEALSFYDEKLQKRPYENIQRYFSAETSLDRCWKLAQGSLRVSP